jgi:hypothetical protein
LEGFVGDIEGWGFLSQLAKLALSVCQSDSVESPLGYDLRRRRVGGIEGTERRGYRGEGLLDMAVYVRWTFMMEMKT